jgi:hypothetical protein
MKKRLGYCTLTVVPVLVLILAALWLGTVAGASANGGTRYVAKPPDGNDSSNDCSNLASPCATVQHAVDVASAGETIKVAGGTYTDTHSLTTVPGGPVVVELTKTVTLRGGYDTSFSEPPDPEANPTALDAEGAARVIYISGAGPTIENFVITGGSASGSGAGVYASNASPTVRGNEIFDNASNHDGGGMWISGGSPLIEGNGVISNSAKWGAGLRIINNSDVTLVGNVIISNVAQNAGGGVDLESHIGGVTPRVFQNTIIHNNGGLRGGGLHVSVADATVVNNLVAHNQAADGAGVYVESYLVAHPISVTLWHNTCVGNAAGDEGVWTGGYVTANLVNNIIADFEIGITNTTPASGTVSADHTLFHSNGTKYGSGVTNSNEVSGDPEFLNPGEGDYHICPHSAAFDAGVDVGVTRDIDGDRRPENIAPDVGADEVAPITYVPLALRRY